jgi:hypothetical protein
MIEAIIRSNAILGIFLVLSFAVVATPPALLIRWWLRRHQSNKEKS